MKSHLRNSLKLRFLMPFVSHRNDGFMRIRTWQQTVSPYSSSPSASIGDPVSFAQVSDSTKWLKSYAMQQWEFDSDQIFCPLNYQVCLIAKNRNCIFRQMAEHTSELSDILSHAGEQFKGKVNVLYIGTDHIHLRIDSPPDYPANEVVQKIMVFFESAVKNEFPKLVDHESSLFEDAYFIESIGD